LARTREQQAELVQLRARLAQLESAGPAHGTDDEGDAPEPGRPWYQPSPEKLAAWVATCHVRTDEPAIDRYEPLTRPDPTRGITADEIDGFNAAMAETTRHWQDLVRSLYIETTGDT